MLTDYELQRYQRQLILPSFGEIGQIKLLRSKVLVVGVGGLGSVSSLYLTAAGVGTVGLVEKDTVSLHNLQRQVLYREDEIGQSKLDLAVRTLSRLNKQTQFEPYHCFLTPDNAEQIIQGYDIVLDCTDN
ncbi:MAG: ThiF family adenylyltransferase, partial [Bacteroidales bacterium]|nr:ThiF family adenylyltransferase [Bacteroidales bacterium]